MKTCPCCGHEIKETRAGVELSAFQALLFDRILASPGLSCGQLGERFQRSAVCIRVHIGKLNTVFACTDVQILGEAHRGYRVHGWEKSQQKRAA